MSKAAFADPAVGASELEGDGFNWRSLLIILLSALTYVGLDGLNGKPRLADIDDALRAIQIEQLWKNGNWYDLTLSMIRMPEAYVSAWSRLIDLPYILIARLLTAFSMRPEAALHWSFLIWPPAMLTAFCVLACDIINRLDLSGRGVRIYLALALILFMLPMVGEFTPGRIDHHNMQILMMALIFAGIMRFTLAGGLISGLGASLLVSISLECMPVVAMIYGALTAAWLLGMPGSRRMLCSMLLTTAIALPLLTLVLTGPTGISSVQCDVISAPYIYIMAGSSLVVGLIAIIMDDAASTWKKAVAVLLPVSLIYIGFVFLFPVCLAGPYAVIDPVSRHFWFDRIEQEKSALVFFQQDMVNQIVFLIILVATLMLALPDVMSRIRSGRAQEFVLYAGALTTLLMTLLLSRFVNYAAAAVPLLLPMAINRIALTLESQQHGKSTAGLWTALAVPLGTGLLLFVLVPKDTRPMDTIDIMNHDGCRRGDMRRLDVLAPGLIMAPPGLAMTMAETMPEGLSIAGIPFHRASPGLNRTYLSFASADGDDRRKALAPFDYLAVCTVSIPLNTAQAPLYAALASGGSWPGLIPIDNKAGQPLKLFLIDHNTLR